MKHIVSAVLTFCVVIAAGFFLRTAGYFTSSETIMYEACRTVLVERLKSPSSYKLLNKSGVTYRIRTLSDLMEWSGYIDEARDRADPAMAELIEENTRRISASRSVRVAKMDILYEAVNGFNAPIADSVICEVETDEDGKLRRIYSILHDVKIDGVNKLDMLLRQR